MDYSLSVDVKNVPTINCSATKKSLWKLLNIAFLYVSSLRQANVVGNGKKNYIQNMKNMKMNRYFEIHILKSSIFSMKLGCNSPATLNFVRENFVQLIKS